MRAIKHRLTRLERMMPALAAHPEEIDAGAWFDALFRHNVLWFDSAGAVVLGSCASPDETPGLQDLAHELNRPHAPGRVIIPLSVDETLRAVAAIDTGELVLSPVRTGDRRFVRWRLSAPWVTEPKAANLVYPVGRAIDALNAQYPGCLNLADEQATIADVRAFLQWRIDREPTN